MHPEDLERYAPEVEAILSEVSEGSALDRSLRRHPRDGKGMFSKTQLLQVYRYRCERDGETADPRLLELLQMKPVRTVSGVAPVTVLTKPWPCPGRCIFCPTDVRMPKSYLHDEPGAMRAEQFGFDPYEQTASRIAQFEGNGHSAEKVELLVLGGTWSSYPREYQESFLRRCLDAMNEDPTGAESLESAQLRNETAGHRNVGLVLETRPDHVSPDEIRWLRRLGATKIQMGAQSLDDRILRANRRGHTVEQTRHAMRLLRAAGFKLVLHWMPNLKGATPASDREDFAKLFSDPSLCPDEIKIYSTQLLPNAELHEHFLRGEYAPYADDELLDLVLECKTMVPEYCRINRIYRDIPSTNVVEGCRMTNMRQHLSHILRERGKRCRCIRCREVKDHRPLQPQLVDRVYECATATEHFLAFEEDDRIAGYLRLSLPERPGYANAVEIGLPELDGAALVREVHVYGPALRLGGADPQRTQHRGLGSGLLEEAESRARARGYRRMTIIASVGTREYYRRHGYRLGETYVTKDL
jgi:elongator complex protein 3